MKIQELENELNISRANIRFYEKERLLNPKRLLYTESLEYPLQISKKFLTGKQSFRKLFLKALKTCKRKLKI